MPTSLSRVVTPDSSLPEFAIMFATHLVRSVFSLLAVGGYCRTRETPPSRDLLTSVAVCDWPASGRVVLRELVSQCEESRDAGAPQSLQGRRIGMQRGRVLKGQ